MSIDSHQPRALKNPALVEERLGQIDLPHVAPLNSWVRDLKARLGPTAIIPWFDPAAGGTEAPILWLLEAPGPKATVERGGSGFISCNNNDPTAENTWRFAHEAGVDQRAVVHWNVIPYYIGTDTKLRAWQPDDVANAAPMLEELMGLLPEVRSVILGGKAAQQAWRDHGPSRAGLKTFECPHPSAQNVNTRPETVDQIVDAWRAAAAWAEADL